MSEREMRRRCGLYRPELEHDNCGIGAIVNVKGKRTHDTVANALKIVENLEHRAGKDAEGETGDGYYRFLTDSSLRSVNLSASFWVRREITAWVCFSSRRMSLREIRRRRFLKSS